MESHAPLPAGTYDIIVIEAEGNQNQMQLEVAITTGPEKGNVAVVSTVGLESADYLLLGTPAVLTVDDSGQPTISW